MTVRIGLYYPFIHFRDEAWLKHTSLYWDRMARIVPTGYGLRDSDTVSEFKDGNYIRDFHPRGEQVEPARAFQEMLTTHGHQLRSRYGLHLSAGWPDEPTTVQSRAAHFGNPKLAYVFGPKIDPQLLDELEALSLAEQGGRRDPRWVGMHPKLASLYMTALAQAIASRRGAHPVTDDALSHVGLGDFQIERLAEALLGEIADPRPRSKYEAEQFMAGLTLRTVVPANIDGIPAKQLIKFRESYAAEREAFQQQIEAMVAGIDVDGISDPDALRDHLQVQHEKLIQPHLADLERRLHGSRIDTTLALINVKTEVPAGLAAVAALLAAQGQSVLGAGAAALGVWQVWQDRRQARRGAIGGLPAHAYLYHIKTGLQPADLGNRIQALGRRLLPNQP
ncbi:hypothetical protein GAR06_06233 [Micromonospora saelicesensis]|uniref:DUF6236 family protein n=1 Tax=Micromonospora saelicesensis TaxID=285676 RepID=UPI000DC47DEE|nr:DUF6236 family protein [Micromonospora saelicesensis]RAO40487.1 hypothetical protein GAR06_06233 [Micromonospora saelicesensis]